MFYVWSQLLHQQLSDGAKFDLSGFKFSQPRRRAEENKENPVKPDRFASGIKSALSSGLKASGPKVALKPKNTNMPMDLKSALSQGHSQLKSVENSDADRFRNEKMQQKANDIRSVMEQGLKRMNLHDQEDNTDHGFDQTFTFS